MQRKKPRTLLIVAGLIVATVAAMGIAGRSGNGVLSFQGVPSPSAGETAGPLTVDARLIQDKVLHRSEGIVTMALTLTAHQAHRSAADVANTVDLVVVLDRSGSMNGRKIADARQAVRRLAGDLGKQDRLALVAYDNTAVPLSGLRAMTAAHRQDLAAAIDSLQPGGGTNLGSGLRAGLDMLAATSSAGRQRKVILISDGLANQGITDLRALGRMAASALAKDWVVSTVGLGNDFNEHLLTTLADHGAGNYYYLENPAAFASVFEREYRQAVAAAASGIAVSIPTPDGIRLIDAGGYPIENRDGKAFFHPGNLRFGQTRTLYLTFKIPTDSRRVLTIAGLQVHFRSNAGPLTAAVSEPFRVACVDRPEEVMASIRKEAWAEKVLQDDFGRLKDAVANAIREGNATQAMERIESYRQEKTTINQVVASPRVAENLAQEVDALGDYVQETFSGQPDEVRSKQKKNAKSLQYEAYQKRRNKQ